MADIFISYARKDQPVARWLAENLGDAGWSVWWDPELVLGDKFEKKILDNLSTVKCVIVIWSKASSTSKWVHAEAGIGLARNCLLPVSLGNINLPPHFAQLQTVDLTGWRGDPAHPAYEELRQGVQRLGGLPPDVAAPPPRIDATRFCVVVARVEKDIGQQLQDVIATDLAEFEGLGVVTIPKSMIVAGHNPQQDLKAAGQRSRDYLEDMGASVMIWGKIIRFGAKEVPQLFLTVSGSPVQRYRRYRPTPHELRLPRIFWSDLADILRVVILTYDADFREREGTYFGDQLRQLIPKIQQLLERANRARGWNADARGLARVSLADALMVLGEQSGDREALDEAVASYRRGLTELTRKQSPREWSRAHNGLGISLWMLGTRLGNREMLEGAAAAYRSALKERRRDREPLDWAQSHNDLGNTLAAIGRMESGTKRLQQAVQEYRTALLERTREVKPLDWAQTKNNLGFALWHLGQRQHGVKHLEEAEDHFIASLSVYTRERTPLDWSLVQNNLGLVLGTRGERENGVERSKAAVQAFRESLKERKRKHVPLLWAQTQNNLGLALWSLGVRTTNDRCLAQAIRAFRDALHEQTLERTPMDWAQTQNNLGAVLWSVGRRKKGTRELEDSIRAYRSALQVYTRQEAAVEWARTLHNLGNALTTLGEREGNAVRLAEARVVLRKALSAYDRDQEPVLWAQTQADLGYSAFLVGKHGRDPKYLREAARAFDTVRRVYEQTRMKEQAEAFGQRARAVRTLITRLAKG